jgi:UDP-N-acetylmuramoyl-tripeptide--D-alanyl-D-alanine ligase
MRPLADRVLTVGVVTPDADLTVRDVTAGPDGRCRARAVTPWGETDVAPPLPGAHQLANALRALAVAGELGVDLVAASAAIAAAPTSASRAVLTQVGGVPVLDDSSHARPPTVIGALATLRALGTTGRRWAVLGTMAELGPSAAARHQEVGRACVGLDGVVTVGAPEIAVGARDGGLPASRVHEVGDVAGAVELLRAHLAPGDAVLLKASRVVGLDRAAAALVAALAGEGAT